MENATPRIAISSGNISDWLKDLEIRFSVNDSYYLDKAIILLRHFQNGGVFQKSKRLSVKEISGVNSSEIAIILLNLRDTGMPITLQRADVSLTSYQDDNGNQMLGEDFVLESTEYLDTALAMLESIKAQKTKYLIFQGGDFIYNGSKLKVSTGTYSYEILKTIYLHLNGISGEISYENLCEELRKLRKFTGMNDKSIKTEIRKHITTKEDTLGKKLKSFEQNGKPLVEVIRGFGIRFNNG